MFCLFYDAKTKKVSAMNGSGRSGSQVTLEKIRRDLQIADGENGHIPIGSGKVSLEEVLAPAIDLAENGFPVSELSATFVRYNLPAYLYND